MKLLLLIAGVVFLQATSIHCHRPPQFEECAKELGITDDMLKLGHEANKGKSEFNCVAACIMKKKGELDAGNKVNLDKVKENMPPKLAERADEVIKFHEECMETAKGNTDECDFANAFEECIHSKFPKGPRGSHQ